ncbi:hydroxyisourate hydrolase [Virgisporangium ochraceum]|uniref:5-hydroxyisourate hydrolase n=1 Tax=Virgisporangium ochraceum TaxID=65505 RepID=A0A8J4A5P9_9ACTN|nr:hydroxyisourate hydrolase [Virgisporangium ochraceum]GIJ75022.1 5-hydroxyisourate hydrolase [Virgisporangium ochraceum]
MNVTAQVLDVVYGRPAAGVPARLERRMPEGWRTIALAQTDENGHIVDWSRNGLEPGTYRIVLDSGSYFANLGVSAAYPEISVASVMFDEADACQIQVMLAPYSYSMFFGART